MQNEDLLSFRVSTALKNIIGRELINDRFIAVFELVKNSYDAGAHRVDIFFEDIYKENPKIIINDDGSGMSFNDIKDKWLFVAYSEKRKKDRMKNDYRNNFMRNVAGAKGVGRFSCDRLGSKLNVYTKTKLDSYANYVLINWTNFEADDTEDFINVTVNYRVSETMPYNSKHGTMLEITDLRESWTRSDFQTLKKSLIKLINPENELAEDKFEIYLNVKEEAQNDETEELERDKVNGKINNDVLEKLDIKTTSIYVDITPDGDTIKTKLYDRGEFIFEFLEKNSKFNLLKDIHFKVFYLNRSAKLNFTKTMGIPPVQYGSVFVYKNGFRVYPYGEFGNDIFGIDRRKSQGRNRFLGTRDLMGRIHINGLNGEFIETSSRNNGFIENESVNELSDFFVSRVLRTLEKYVVDIIDWGDPSKEDWNAGVEQGLMPSDVIDKIVEQFTSYARRKDIIEISYNPDIMSFMDAQKEQSIIGSLSELEKVAIKSNNDSLFDLSKQIERDTRRLLEQKKEAEKEVESISTQLETVQNENILREKQNFFLQSIAGKDAKFLLNGMHLIFTHSDASKKSIEYLEKTINSYGKEIEEKCKGYLSEILINNQKINKYSEYGIKGSFELKPQKSDIRDFITQYIDMSHFKGINIKLNSDNNKDYICYFDVSSIGIIIDNVVSNSKKADSKDLIINIQETDKNVLISFRDNGKGLSDKISNPNILFELGTTTTNGFGMGLCHIKELVEGISGEVRINEEYKNGFEIEMRLNR